MPAFRAWQRLQTQWRTGATGAPTGLDYAAVNSFLRDVLGLKPRRQAALFGSLQAMEIAALKAWSEQESNPK